MRFSGERQVTAPIAEVWASLHERSVLSRVIPGCHDMVPLGEGQYSATLQARVGPVADTYTGRFSIEDMRPGHELLVRVEARGRCGRLQVDLRVILAEATHGTTALRYDADATVGGLASRLGRATLAVTGGHFTGCFFRDLDRSLRRGSPVPVERVPAPAGA
jgi:uncharacterized protein